MTTHPSRRWFQLSLKPLFLLTLVVAAFFAGYSLATKRMEAKVRTAEEALPGFARAVFERDEELERLRKVVIEASDRMIQMETETRRRGQ